MKRLILQVLIIWLLPEILVSQAENKLLTNNKVWHVEGSYACTLGGYNECYCYVGMLTSKTGNSISINGKQYTEILSNIYKPDEWEVQAYLREENNQIFFYSEKYGREFLMYDFNLKIDDKVILADYLWMRCDLNELSKYFTYTVTGVDSVLYNQKKYKRIRLKGNMSLNWIEGIGDITGLLYHSEFFTGQPQLKDCYEADKQVFFNDKPQYCFKNPDDSQANPKSFEISDTLFYGMDIKKIARDSKDTIWFVSDGLYKSYGDSVWRFSEKNSSLLAENIRDIAIDSGDTIWMITDKGLLKYDHKNFNAIGNQGIHYNNLVIDKYDNIWLSKTGGIVKFNKKGWQVFTKENSRLPSSFIHSMVTDIKKNIWIAACDKVNEGSIVRINGDEWTVFDKVNTGIPMYYFMNKSLVADKKGNIYAKIDYALSSSINTGKPNILKYDGIRWSVIDSVSNTMDLVELIGCGGDNIIWKKNISGTSLSYYDGAWHNWSDFDHNIKDITAGTGSDTWFCTNNGVYVIKSESFESVFNQISGVWYKVFSYSGLTGKKDTLYSNDINVIKRITGTDSIAWTISENNIVKSVSKFRLTYADSYLHGEKRWMLTSDGLKLLFDADSLFMTCGIDAYDAGALGYSRKKIVSGLSVPDNDEFRYYVDPLGSILNISGLTDIEHVSFFDVNGHLLHKATPLPNGSFDIRCLEKGLYVIQVVSRNTVYPGKIIKK